MGRKEMNLNIKIVVTKPNGGDRVVGEYRKDSTLWAKHAREFALNMDKYGLKNVRTENVWE